MDLAQLPTPRIIVSINNRPMHGKAVFPNSVKNGQNEIDIIMKIMVAVHG